MSALTTITPPVFDGNPPAKVVREIMVDLWTRCHEASFRANVAHGSLSRDPGNLNGLGIIKNIAAICSVDAIYVRMQQVLSDYAAAQEVKSDDRTNTIADMLNTIRLLQEENACLRAESRRAA